MIFILLNDDDSSRQFFLFFNFRLFFSFLSFFYWFRTEWDAFNRGVDRNEWMSWGTHSRDEKLRNIINIKITYRHNCIDELES